MSLTEKGEVTKPTTSAASMESLHNTQGQEVDQFNNIAHLQLKVPAFMEDSVDAWFIIIEAQFVTSRISTASTKFYTTLSHLPPSVVKLLPKRILTSKDYDCLKEAVINVYEKSKPELLDKLLKNSSLTGRPSLFLQELMSTAERIDVGEIVVRFKFLDAMPSTIRTVLASQKELNLIQLGQLADDLMPYIGNQVNNVMNVNTNYPSNNKKKSNGNNNNSNAKLPFGFRPFSEGQRPKICRYHLYFGKKAKVCKPWCDFPNKANCKMEASSRPNSRSSSPAPSQSTQENQ